MGQFSSNGTVQFLTGTKKLPNTPSTKEKKTSIVDGVQAKIMATMPSRSSTMAKPKSIKPFDQLLMSHNTHVNSCEMVRKNIGHQQPNTVAQHQTPENSTLTPYLHQPNWNSN